MTTLKPTIKNVRIFGICLTANDWARNATGADEKTTGKEGFENFRSGNWNHTCHYKLISKENPHLSPPGAIEEMSEMRESLLSDIDSTSKLLDEQIKRLSKMEEQMKDVMEA